LLARARQTGLVRISMDFPDDFNASLSHQLAGAYGLSEEYPFERYFRDCRGMSIGYGTVEIHKNSIAREILGGRYSF